MKKNYLFVLFTFCIITSMIANQNIEYKLNNNAKLENVPDTTQPSNDTDNEIEVYEYEPIRKGDKFVRIGIGLGIPLFNTSRSQFAILPKMYPGPKILLGMHFYLTKNFSLGGDLSLEFYPTIGKNLYFSVPITLTMAYTHVYKKWRFPMGCSIGGAVQSYQGTKYFGMYIKPFFSFFYQYSPEWSFGGELDWAIAPEWRKETSNNRVHNNMGISFTVRYHL